MSDTLPIVPVVVIKGRKQWIEWKRFVRIYENYDREYIGISLRFYEKNKRWEIECMDYDSGRVYYQHKLMLLQRDDKYCFSYGQIENCITTILSIYECKKQNRQSQNLEYNSIF